MTEQEIQEIKDKVTDHISYMEFSEDEIEGGCDVEFELDDGNIYFEGKIVNSHCKDFGGCYTYIYDVEGTINVPDDNQKDEFIDIDYEESGFKDEFIYDYYSYYGVSQSDFL